MDLHKLTKWILAAHRKSLMAELEQSSKKEPVPQGMSILENASLYDGPKHNAERQS